ncbi:MATE family efflux transporter [Humitalea sp. 24SJ18S-53]|uniref:MATE family efflux transporter n=1 Tax=Humitalea sp. 24SJ18S-53 TaxID=3422307 RepID=UPI003D67DE9C
MPDVSPPVPAPPAISGIFRQILALAAPTSLVAAIQATAQIIETVLAARQGTAALAGWAVVLPFALLMQQMSTGAMGGGVVSAIARALGAGRRDDASALVLHAMLIAAGFAAGFMLLMVGFPGPILRLVGGPEAAAAAIPYALILFGLGALPAWMANTLASVLRGGGRHGLAARTMVVAWIAYPILAWALAEPFGMGLPGLGLAFAIVFAAASVAMWVTVALGGAGFVPHWRVPIQRVLFGRILSVGLIACVLAALANLTTILVTAQLVPWGVAAVAAYGIAARLEFLMVPLSFGVGSALTALVGRAVGAQDWVRARRTAWVGGGLALLVAGSAGVVVGVFPGPVAAAFSTDPAVLAIAAGALAITGPALGGFGLGMAMYFAAQGAGRMTGPLLAAICRIGFAVGGGWLLAGPLGMGLAGHFWGVAAGITAYGLVTAASVRPSVWR